MLGSKMRNYIGDGTREQSNLHAVMSDAIKLFHQHHRVCSYTFHIKGKTGGGVGKRNAESC